jgi:toxin ParE1/3/4
MKILWTEPAIEDLRNLHGYIAKDSDVYASSFVQRIILAVDRLSDFPRLGRIVPEAEQETIRELLYQNYRIIYRIKSDFIEILTVIHGRRDLGSFKRAPWDVD